MLDDKKEFTMGISARGNVPLVQEKITLNWDVLTVAFSTLYGCVKSSG